MDMDQHKVLAEEAVAYFAEGYNCAQSILMTMFRHWKGMNELVPKIATCFGGGIGRCGSVCGAVTGGAMALGIKFGTNEPSSEKRMKAYELAQRLYRRFEEENGSVLCRELIGCDLSDPVELEKARESKVFERKCHAFIINAVEILVELTEDSR
jgi:C_GCAxxG_C_C family probable redox protein